MRAPWRLPAVVSMLALFAAALPVVAHATTSPVNWERESPSASPPARTWAASAYDSNRNRLVVYGGSSNGGADLGDTWEWDGSTWSMLKPAVSPPVLAGATMAYDSARGVSVLFGGSTPTATTSDTWEWDGTNWTRRALATSPPPMVWATMVYDSARSRMVLFGSYSQFGVAAPQTWEFDGTGWTQAHPASSPSARTGAGMAFDSTRNRVVLFGGHDSNSGQRMADTWQWDGANWVQLTPSVSPYARLWHAMAYDPVRDRIVLFGGDHIQPYSLGDENDTWEWDGAQWRRDWTDAAPSIRAGHSMVYDSGLGRMVLFGGFNAGVTPNTFSNETWELGGGVVTPAGSPALSIGLTSGEFGSVDVGASSSPAVIGVVSSGTGPAATTMSTSGDFSITSTDCPSAPDPLAAGAGCLMFLAFSPTAPGDRYGNLTVTGNLSGGTIVIPLHGVGLGGDFTISTAPGNVGALIGDPIPAVTITTAAIGTLGTVALSTLPATDPGITASFSPSSVTAGGSSTMTISVAPTVVPGVYGIRVVGSESGVTHYADVTIRIFAIPDFTITADTTAVTLPHGTQASIGIVATAINGVVSLNLSASVAPAGPTVTIGQFMSSGGVAGVTVAAPFRVAPGHYTVTITATTNVPTHPITHTVTFEVTVTERGFENGGFETADLSGWSSTGITGVVRYPVHSGAYSAQVGTPGLPTPFVGNSTISQTFDVPTTASKLTFWYWTFCNDKVKNDWFTASLQDGVTGATTVLAGPVCTKNAGWTKVTVNLSSYAGHFVTLTFVNHDDGAGGTETYSFVDDVSLK